MVSSTATNPCVAQTPAGVSSPGGRADVARGADREAIKPLVDGFVLSSARRADGALVRPLGGIPQGHGFQGLAKTLRPWQRAHALRAKNTPSRRAFLLVDAIIGSILLGVALTSIIALASRALSAQTEGEELQTAAMLIDEQLALVLARGPDSYASRFDTEGECDPPFQRFHYALALSGGQGGDPYKVTATVTWTSGGRERSESVDTLIAPRLGDDPDPDRRPPVTVDRMQ